MIRIFQPPPLARSTGGYLYNARVAAHLPGTSLHDVAPGALGAALAAGAPGDARLVDSLYIGTGGLPEAMARHRAIALVHHLPSCDPGFPAERRAAQQRDEAAFLRAAAGAVVPSGFMAELVRGRGAPDPIVARPGVDDELFAVVPAATAGEVEVVTIANLEPRKGILEHVAPLARVAAVRPFRWHLIGADADPVYAAEVRAAIAESGLAPRATLHGGLGRAALCDRLARASAHLFPSRFESYGMAVAESLAAGVPVIAPAIGELPRLVRDGETGALAPPGDPAALAELLSALLADRGRLAAMRRACLARRGDLRRWPAVARELAALAEVAR